MEIFQAIFLGIIEGLTEFLPISSTGHLIVAQDAIGFYDASKMFTVVIQMGAVMAILWFYRKEFVNLAKGLITGNSGARRIWTVWVIATIPAGIFGLLFDSVIETYAITLTVAIALIVGGVIIWIVEEYHNVPSNISNPKLEKISIKQAIKIGFFQTLALIPGVSRSGATIIGGMLAGLDRVTATTYSFYLGLPILFLAGIYKLITGEINSVVGGWPVLLVGIVSSFIISLLVIGWLLKYVSRHDFKLFAYYRIIFGVLLLVLVLTGILS